MPNDECTLHSIKKVTVVFYCVPESSHRDAAPITVRNSLQYVKKTAGFDNGRAFRMSFVLLSTKIFQKTSKYCTYIGC